MDLSQVLAPDETGDLQVISDTLKIADASGIPTLVYAKFSQTTGALSVALTDGTALECRGFLTPTQLQAGERGKRGPAGYKGRGGRAGRDGATGCTGCDGEDGLIGEIGPAGATGEDGPDGPTGPMGYRGARGETGPQGPTGVTGNQGVVGAKGPCCISGPTGERGPQPQPVAIFSKTIPDDEKWFAWVLPVDANATSRPQIPQYSAVRVQLPNQKLVAKRYKMSSTYVGHLDLKASVTGGTGSYEYDWDYPVVSGVAYIPDGDVLRISFSGGKALAQQTALQVVLKVRDAGRPTKPMTSGKTVVKIGVQ